VDYIGRVKTARAAALLIATTIAWTTPAAPVSRPEAIGAASPRPSSPADPIAEGLRALHQGLFARAEEIFRSASRVAPDEPEPMLFVAFSRWWRMILEDRPRGAADERFDAALDAVLDAGERRLESAPDDARARAALGTAHILRSHVEALRRNYLHAAQEARRGRRLLEAALDKEPRLTDALFPLGALNYYADRVPAIVKGIRALLFLPGGDAERGLDQLRAVAASEGRFRTDARLLLALICAGRDEGCYRAALGQLEAALRDNPGSPLVLASRAEIEARLGYYDEAVRDYERALAEAQGEGPDRARQRRTLRLALADTLLAAWRIERAARILQEGGPDAGAPTGSLAKARARITHDLALRRGEIPLAREAGEGTAPDPSEGDRRPPAPAAEGAIRGALRQALEAQEEGRLEDALAALERAPLAGSGDPLAAFLRGRVLFLLDRPDEAARALEEARALASEPPPWMEGWIELYLGMIDARRGKTRAARAHFHTASEIRGFRSADRGLFELAPGGDPSSHCAAPEATAGAIPGQAPSGAPPAGPVRRSGSSPGTEGSR
jgi:tetratricopeptide (TPR) repeat protein